MKAKEFLENGFGEDCNTIHKNLVIELMENYAKHYTKQLNIGVVSSSLPKNVRQLKGMCCAFFRYWWNAEGNNTEQGFDEWYSKWDDLQKAVMQRSEQLPCERCKKLEFMIENGLGWKDMENDCT